MCHGDSVCYCVSIVLSDIHTEERVKSIAFSSFVFLLRIVLCHASTSREVLVVGE